MVEKVNQEEIEKKLFKVRDETMLKLNKIVMDELKRKYPEVEKYEYEEWVVKHFILYFNFVIGLFKKFLDLQDKIIEEHKQKYFKQS